MEPFIVAEIAKNWDAEARRQWEQGARDVLASRFEKVINTNLGRGYRLHSFQLNRMMLDERVLNETIIAVFERMAKSSSTTQEVSDEEIVVVPRS